MGAIFMPMNTILVTGANGLLGQKLVQLIIADGKFKVLATGRGAWRMPLESPHFSYAELDVTNEYAVDELLRSVKPSAVVHTAAMTNVDQCEAEKEACRRLNVTATANLAHACERNDIYFLHLSTDFIFDGTKGPLTEEERPNPISFYGQSKADAEAVVMSIKNLRWGIARTILVYGIAHDMSRSNIALWVKGSLEAGKQIQVVNDQWRTPTLAEDLAMGCYLLAAGQHEGIYNIGGPELLTPYEMAVQVAEYFDLDASLIQETDGSKFSQPAKRPPRTGLDITKAREVIGYEPKTFKQGLAVLASQMG